MSGCSFDCKLSRKIENILDNLPRFHEFPGLSRIGIFVKENNISFDSLTIIVAGTNGKGSTVSMLENILKKSSINAGVMRSPHIHTPCERISVGGEQISGDEFLELLNFTIKFFKNKKIDATLADITTACAFLHFSHYKKPHFIILEAGMGGRLDPVNIARRDISVITNIGRDHTAILGEYPEGPAYAKAGIIKEGIPLFTGETNPEVLGIFREICNKNNTSCLITDTPQVLDISSGGTEFIYKEVKHATKLIGLEQAKNASLVLDIAEYIKTQGFNLPVKSVEEGLMSTTLPWRMELFSNNPPIYLDGAHNRESWRNLRDTLKYFHYENLNIIPIILKRKIIEDFPGDFPGNQVRLYIPHLRNRKYEESGELSRKIEPFRGKKVLCNDLADSIERALNKTGSNDMLIITGTLGIAGEIGEILSEKVGSSRSVKVNDENGIRE